MSARIRLSCPLFFVLVLTTGGTFAAEEARQQPPNIIFILADDLGYGDLGCYGQTKIQTPHIDQMATEGMRFTQFYAGSTVCAPSRCVLMTGLHLGHCYIRGNSRMDLRPEDVTVAELLKDAGYKTGLYGKWGLGHEGSLGVPTKQGFDEFFGYLHQGHAHNYYPTFLVRNEERVLLKNIVPNPKDSGAGKASKKLEYSHDLIAEEALKFVDRNKDHPFFLYLALTIPHANNEAGQEGMEVPDSGIYKDRDWPEPQKGHAAMITRMDRDVGRLMQKLKQHGIDKNTVVMFTSDNGPHREGGNDPNFANSNGPLRGIKRDLYEGGIRVPMIVRWPGKTPANSESNFIGSFFDFLPTAMELAGKPVSVKTDGISFVPAMLGKDQRPHKYLYWEFYERGSAQAVRFGDWKGVIKPFGGDTVELYNLNDDLGEENNIADKHPEVVKRIHAIVKDAHTPSPHWKPRQAKPRQRKPKQKTTAVLKKEAARGNPKR